MPAGISDIQTFTATLSDAQARNPVLARLLDKVYDGVMGATPTLKWLESRSEDNKDNFVRWRVRKAPKEATAFDKASGVGGGFVADPDNPVIPMAKYGIAIDYAFSDLLQCTSTDGFDRYITGQVEEMVDGMSITLSKRIFGSGTADVEGTAHSAFPEIYGLQYALDTTGYASTVFGLTRSASTTSINCQTKTVTAITDIDVSAIQELVAKCRKTTLIVTNQPVWNRLWNISVAKNWPTVPIASMTKLDIGYPTYINFQGIPIVADPYMTGTSDGGYISSTLKRMFFLNDEVKWFYDSRNKMKKWAPQLMEDAYCWRQRVTHSAQLLPFDLRGVGQLSYTNA